MGDVMDILAGLTPETFAELYKNAVKNIYLTRLIACVSASIIFYDFVISLDREVELVWRKRWSIIKLAFLWFRYFGICCTIVEFFALSSSFVTDEFCYFFIQWEAWSGIAVLITTELVQILWIFVLFNKDIRVLYGLLILFVGEFAAAITLLANSLPHIDLRARILPGMPFCVVLNTPNSFYMFWIPILAFHTVILALYLYQGYKVFGKRASLWRNLGLLELIYKDSLINFLSICAGFFICVVMWAAAEIGLRQIPVSITRALVITNCTRLLLNIRHAYYSRIKPLPVDQNVPSKPCESKIESMVDFDDDRFDYDEDIEMRQGRLESKSNLSIHADQVPSRFWAFELRQMKWAGDH